MRVTAPAAQVLASMDSGFVLVAVGRSTVRSITEHLEMGITVDTVVSMGILGNGAITSATDIIEHLTRFRSTNLIYIVCDGCTR